MKNDTKKTVKVSEYVEQYNKNHDDKIDRFKVYKMIKDGKLSGEKNKSGHWIITLNKKSEKEYTPTEFVEKYNKKHPKRPITIKKIRSLASEGKIKAKKKLNKWIITENPNKKIVE